MSKIKVLVIPKDREITSTYRLIKPHLHLQEKYPNDFFIDIDFYPNMEDEKYIKQYDIVVYNEYWATSQNGFINKLEEYGIKGVLDIQENWTLEKNHPLYKYVKHQSNEITEIIKISNFVTASTPSLLEKIQKLNENTALMLDGVDHKEPQYNEKTTKSKRIRFGWVGDEYCMDDIMLLKGLLRRLKNDNLLDKIQFVLCGFHLNQDKQQFNKETNKNEMVKKTPKETSWYQYEELITDNYSMVSETYKKFLLTFKEEQYPDVENEPYKRVWKKNNNSCGKYYSEFDVTLAPTDTSTNNVTTSPVRVMESGFNKKPIIAQDYGAFQIDLNNAYQKGGGLNLTANALLVEPRKNHKDWYKYIKKLVINESVIKVLGQNLYDAVKNKYALEVISEERKTLFKSLVTKK